MRKPNNSSGCVAAALLACLAMLLTGCATVPPEPAVTEAPVHVNTIGQMQDGHRLRFAVCLACPEQTPKNLGGEPMSLAQRAPVLLAAKPVSLTPRAMVATVNFDFASSAVTARARAALDALRPVLGLASDVHVTGFTDDVGPMGINSRLASQRAQSVLQALGGSAGPAHGMPSDGGLRPLVQRSGPGGGMSNAAGRPLCCYVEPNLTEHGRASNRRAELTFTVPRMGATDIAVQKAAAVASLREASGAEAAGRSAATAADQPNAQRP